MNRKQREKCYNAFENLMHDAYKIRIKILTGQNLRYDNTNEFFHHHSSNRRNHAVADLSPVAAVAEARLAS